MPRFASLALFLIGLVALVVPATAQQRPASPAAESIVIKPLGIGLADLGDDLRKRHKIGADVRGAVVTSVEPGSAGADKGLAVGDVITQVASEAVTNARDVQRRVERLEKDGRRSALLLVSGANGETRFVAVALAALPRRVVDDAETCKARGDDAIAACTRRIQSGSVHGRDLALLYLYRGYMLVAKGERDRGIADYDEAIRLDPGNARAHHNRGFAHQDKHDLDRAVADFSETIRLDPGFASAYLNRGEAYRVKRDYDRAIADISEAIRLEEGQRTSNPLLEDELFKQFFDSNRSTNNLSVAYNNRGVTYSSKGELDRAIADYDESIRLDPKEAVTYKNRGQTHQRKGDLDRAIADFDQAIALSPKFAEAYLRRGAARGAKGDPDGAIADYSEAVRHDSRYVAAYNTRGVAYETKGDLAKALVDFRTALGIDPSSQTATAGVRRLEQRLAVATKPAATQGAGDVAACNKATGDDAIAACTRRIEAGEARGEDLASVHLSRGIAWSGKRDYDRAIADYDEAIRLSPSLARAYHRRGDAHAGKRDHDRAIVDFSEAIRLSPIAVTYNNRGHSYVSKRDDERAIADFSEAIRLDPKLVQAYGGRGAALTRKGEHDRAIADLNEAIRLDPKLASAYNARGLAHERKGELEKALVDFRVTLSLDARWHEATLGAERVERKLRAHGETKPSSAALAPVPGRRVALVVGNDKYEHLEVLQKAVNDARAVGDRLSRLGFEVIRVDNATRRQMNEKLTELTGKISRGDTAFFFFAGHGVEIKGGNYLLPIDTPKAREGQDGLIAREGIAADSIVEALQERGARVSLLVLDACRNNPFRTATGRGVGGGRGLGRMDAPEGVFVLYSAGSGQVALDRLSDSDTHPNSVFTRTFVQLLDRPGVSLQELAKATQGEVKKLAASVSHLQMPAYYDQVDGTLALALPADHASQGEKRRAWIGLRIQQVTDEAAQSLGITPARGARVIGVDEKGPAKPAGVEIDDVVIQLDGKEIKEMADLPRIVTATPIGKEVEVVIVRKGKEETRKVKVGQTGE